MEFRKTNVWVVLDEVTLQLAIDKESNEDIKTRTFKSEEEANTWASETLNVWSCINLNFKHKFVHHKVNQ